jgi:hypothetical protein
MMHISYHEEKKYSKCIDCIVENHLDDFGETCWLEDDNDFRSALSRLMAHLPQGTKIRFVFTAIIQCSRADSA